MLCYYKDDRAMRPINRLEKIIAWVSSSSSSFYLPMNKTKKHIHMHMKWAGQQGSTFKLAKVLGCTIGFQDFQPLWPQSTNVTDRQVCFLAGYFDGRTIIIPKVFFSWMAGGVINSISQCSPGSRWMVFIRRAKVLGCAIGFQDFQPLWPQSTNVTDRQMDDMRS